MNRMRNLVFKHPLREHANNCCDVSIEILDKDGYTQCCFNKKFLIEKQTFSISINNFPNFVEIEDNNENKTQIASHISKNACFEKI